MDNSKHRARTRVRVAVVVVALLGTGVAIGATRSSSAVVTSLYRYHTGLIRTGNDGTAASTIRVDIVNQGPGPLRVNAFVTTSDGSRFPFAENTVTIPAGQAKLGAFVRPSGTTPVDVIIESSTDEMWLSLSYFANDGKTKFIDHQDFIAESDLGTAAGLAGRVLDRVQLLDERVGNNTAAFCAEGSVRADANGNIQSYVTLFSELSQTVTVNHITSRGPVPRLVPLLPNTRFTEDVNAFLLGPAGAFPGATDVDTSIEVLSLNDRPFFLACPVYFERSIGAAGPVNGGAVQDGSHN